MDRDETGIMMEFVMYTRQWSDQEYWVEMGGSCDEDEGGKDTWKGGDLEGDG
jgi:hypothetical protein